MSENWDNKDFIEGEYEILEEKDINIPTNNEYGSHADRRNNGPGGNGYDRYTSYDSHSSSDQNSYLSIDNRPPYVTYILLGVNIAAWLLMTGVGWLFHLDINLQLFLFGAKENSMIAYGQTWRLLTAMFLHIGIVHLFFNSYALYIYGPIVEKLFGKVKFAAIYLLSGLMGSLLSYLFSPNAAAGASGAIFGLLGSLLYFRQRKKDIFRRVFGTGLIMIIGINLFYGMVQPGIDNWGHIGGMLGGYLLGNAVGLYRENKLDMKKILIWILIGLMFVFGLSYGRQKYTVKSNMPMRSKDSLEGTFSFACDYKAPSDSKAPSNNKAEINHVNKQA